MSGSAGGGGRLVLVDGHSLLHRAFYALPALSNEQGQPTNAVYGFLSMLLRLLDQERPRYLAVAMDLPTPTFRHRQYEDYKAHRPATPDDLRAQVPILREILDTLHIPVYQCEGFEADDVIGTLAGKARSQDLGVLIVTGDRDVLQLVDDGVDALIMRRGVTEFTYYDVGQVRRAYGVDAALLVDVKALMGDASDNIPGVPGVGEKTALALVRELGQLETILESLDQVKGKKLPARLAQHREQAMLSKTLAAINTDVPVELDLERCVLSLPDQAGARDVLLKYGFRSLLERLPRDPARQARIHAGQEPAQTRVALSQDDLETSLASLAASDTEQVPLGIWGETATGTLAGIGLSSEDESWFWPCRESGHGSLSARQVLESLGRLLRSVSAVAGFDVKPLLVALGRDGVISSREISSLVPGVVTCDSAVAAYLLDPARTRYSLSGLALHHLDLDVPSREDLLGKGRGARTTAETPVGELASYYGSRARAAGRLAAALAPELVARGLDRVLSDIEMPLLPVLARMEVEGFLVDASALSDMAIDMRDRAASLEREIHRLAGREFNVSSPQQLAQVLFEDLSLSPVRKTKTGYSTDAAVLEELTGRHPVVEEILQYRQITKLLGTYVNGLAAQVAGDTGRIHTTFNQTVTATGRLSTAEPNLQNIPVRDEVGRQLRRAFVAPQGYMLLAADYSQIELRLLAHLSGDERLIGAFADGADIHSSTAAEVFGVKEVTRAMRDAAKAVNFGIIYGMSGYGLSRTLKISQEEAADYIQRYFDRYPGVRRYLRMSVETARDRGYASTLYGRTRYLPEIRSRSWQRRSLAERMAMNTPIQGTAADIIKQAMVRVQDELDASAPDARLLLQVHDELILEVAAGQVDEVRDLVSGAMEGVADLSVPLEVDTGVGRSWYEVKGG